VYVYDWALATPGVLTTNGTANTETDAFFVAASASKTVGLSRVDLIGSVSGATTLSTIKMRLARFGTASTAGTAITPAPAEGADAPASAATMASRPTSGASRTEHGVFGCSHAGPGSWAALNEAHIIKVRGGSGDSVDGLDISPATSLTFEVGGQIVEW
jgi:hypothetical protein